MKKKARPKNDLAFWAKPPTVNCWAPGLFSGFPHRWSHNLLVLRTSPKSQPRDHNGHDHDHFQKFQSKSPPFVAGCSGLFRQGTRGKQCFS